MVKGHKNDGGRGNLIKINFGCGGDWVVVK
jgi:hypothetical protein